MPSPYRDKGPSEAPPEAFRGSRLKPVLSMVGLGLVALIGLALTKAGLSDWHDPNPVLALVGALIAIAAGHVVVRTGQRLRFGPLIAIGSRTIRLRLPREHETTLPDPGDTPHLDVQLDPTTIRSIVHKTGDTVERLLVETQAGTISIHASWFSTELSTVQLALLEARASALGLLSADPDLLRRAAEQRFTSSQTLELPNPVGGLAVTAALCAGLSVVAGVYGVSEETPIGAFALLAALLCGLLVIVMAAGFVSRRRHQVIKLDARGLHIGPSLDRVRLHPWEAVRSVHVHSSELRQVGLASNRHESVVVSIRGVTRPLHLNAGYRDGDGVTIPAPALRMLLDVPAAAAALEQRERPSNPI